jgi:hypothetical protein
MSNIKKEGETTPPPPMKKKKLKCTTYEKYYALGFNYFY